MKEPEAEEAEDLGSSDNNHPKSVFTKLWESFIFKLTVIESTDYETFIFSISDSSNKIEVQGL